MAQRNQTGVSALQFLPERISMASLREAALACQGCPLYKDATQTVCWMKGSAPRELTERTPT